MSERRKYMIYFNAVDGEDGFLVPEVTLDVEYEENDYEGLQMFNPPHPEYEYMPDPEEGKPGPTWGEVAEHEGAWEDKLVVEVLDPLADDMEAVLREVMSYAEAGHDLTELAQVIKERTAEITMTRKADDHGA